MVTSLPKAPGFGGIFETILSIACPNLPSMDILSGYILYHQYYSSFSIAMLFPGYISSIIIPAEALYNKLRFSISGWISVCRIFHKTQRLTIYGGSRFGPLSHGYERTAREFQFSVRNLPGDKACARWRRANYGVNHGIWLAWFQGLRDFIKTGIEINRTWRWATEHGSHDQT